MTPVKPSAQASLSRRISLFGNPTKTGILTALALLNESYPRELARLLNVSLSAVQVGVDSLERQGVIATRRVGTERRVALDRRYPGSRELKDLLFKLLDAQPSLVESIRATRRRPRRRRKPL